MTNATATFLLRILDSLTVQVGPNFEAEAAMIVTARAELAAVLNEE